jgi:hypothetical protein
MFAVEVYAAVRQFVFIEGNSRREAARVFGLSRETIAKMCRFSLPPGYTRSKPVEKPKLGPLLPVITAILGADRSAPVKQRHTAKRIFERLRDEHGYTGGYTVVKDHVRICRAQGRETFVPLAHPPGHAQVDFGEAVATIGGVRRKIHFLCMDLPHSDACFVKAYPRETTEAFLDGHVAAFGFEPVDEIDHGVEAAPRPVPDAGARDRDGQVRLARAGAPDQHDVALALDLGRVDGDALAGPGRQPEAVAHIVPALLEGVARVGVHPEALRSALINPDAEAAIEMGVAGAGHERPIPAGDFPAHGAGDGVGVEESGAQLAFLLDRRGARGRSSSRS